MRKPIAVAEDRSIRVPHGARVVTGRVPCHRIRLSGRDTIAVGDVAIAFQRRLQNRDGDLWPPPVGVWEEDPVDGAQTCVLLDGGADYIAALMAGWREILVAWVEDE